MIEIEIKFFAAAAEIAGVRSLNRSVPCGTTLGELRQQLLSQHAELGPLAAASRWAVGTHFASDDFQFSAPTAVAMIPPVSGG